MNRKALISGTVLIVMGCSIAKAQPVPPGPDPYGYYSQYDQNGYYDREGRYHSLSGSGPAYTAPMDYQAGRYEAECNRGNAAAGTIFGAIAGGLLGGAVSRGNGGAVIGGAVLGGVLGNVISRDIACEDQPYAYRVYADGLNGDLGRRYEWRHDRAYGYFTPEREFRREGQICRSFTRSGTACRQVDGNWRFD